MKLLAEDHVVEFLVSRGLYVLANSAVPVLLAIAVASEGYSASGVGLVLGVGTLPGILGALLAPQMLVHVAPRPCSAVRQPHGSSSAAVSRY